MIRRTTKSGFTLVELLVAMALAVVLLALAIGVSQSSAFDSQKVVGSADRLTEWMIAAKSKALRDKAPRGIRLIPDTANPEIIREIAYIEQPDPIPSNGPMLLGSRLVFYYPCQVIEDTMAPPPTYNFDGLPAPSAPAPNTSPASQKTLFLAGLSAAQQTSFTSTVQSGDLISIPELRSVLKLGTPAFTVVAAASSPSGATLRLNVTPESLPDLGRNVYSYHDSSRRNMTLHPNVPPTLLSGTLSVTNFSIIRAARPILGEPTQQLPSGMAVDVRAAQTTSLNPPAADVNGNRDILFAPTGEVIGATEALTVLLVRDANLPNVVAPLGANYDQAGQMILICLYNKTGAIATQPVNPPPSPDPYRFARDGINTGL
ncbi:MAG: prepilin-type N-terminal cleavage/methylation domain-containing protein [Planctomycetia bacterium]|nr:prepilin-type N-terminal cleavage/methylation domain-containing protein [Planctomycetia bacterium]